VAPYTLRQPTIYPSAAECEKRRCSLSNRSFPAGLQLRGRLELRRSDDADLGRGVLRRANGSEAKLRRGRGCRTRQRRDACRTNDLSAGSVCKRRDAVRLGRKKGLQPRANERPAGSFSFKLASDS
jgi:hypothetical protein